MVEKLKRTGEQPLNSSTLAFFSKLIDYAGLFPPAQLPLEQAIRNYAAYQNIKDAWMLGHFVIPTTRLDELTPYVSLFSENKPLSLAATGQKGQDRTACLEMFAADLEKINRFSEMHGVASQINVYEMPLPPIVPDLDLLETLATKTKKLNLQTFCEVTIPLIEEWEQQMLLTLDQISLHNQRSGLPLGLKLRTGGLSAEAFPTPEQVASVLVNCSKRGIPQKFTAGLHHPIRMYHKEVELNMHGFINVFVAGMLARTKKWELATITEILADEDAATFTFTDEGLSWKGKVVSVSEIQQFRINALCSFGSCSFDEPREDLQKLQMI